MDQPIYIVLSSPWSKALPEGTEIIICEPREGSSHTHKAKWFQRLDGKLLFEDVPEESDGKFRLYHHEYTLKNS